MKENFDQLPPKTPEDFPNKEGAEELRKLFDEAEAALNKPEDGEGDREKAKPLLPRIYDNLIALNGREKRDADIWIWNPDGNLTEEEFDELNLRRKKLSNAVGIMTKSGVVRHDLNEI